MDSTEATSRMQGVFQDFRSCSLATNLHRRTDPVDRHGQCRCCRGWMLWLDIHPPRRYIVHYYITKINLHYIGEIAATYEAGLLAASNAVRIAYFRGFYAKLAKSPEAALVPCGCWHLYRGRPRLLQSSRIQRPNPNRCSQLRVKHYSLR